MIEYRRNLEWKKRKLKEGAKILRPTNYVIVTDYAGEEFLPQVYLLGWDSNEDWFDTGIDGSDIMTPSGNVKKNSWGLIDVTKMISAYVGETAEDCAEYADGARNEGYDCTICRLEKDSAGKIKLIPEDEDDFDEDEEVDESYTKKALKETATKKSSLTERFMSIHEKPSTRFNKNLKKVYEMLDKYGTEKEDVDKVFNRASLKERLEMVKLLKEGSETEGKTVVQLSIAQEEPYYDCGDLCGIYEEKVILDDSKVDAFIADLTSYCKKIKSGAIYDEVEDWDIYDCFEYYLDEIFEKHGAKVYSKKKGDKVSIETFEYNLY